MKKIKMQHFDLLNFCGFYAESRAKFANTKGYLYKMDRLLTDQEKEKILSYKNTLIFTMAPEYAPEMKRSAVFLGDKCFKKEVTQ